MFFYVSLFVASLIVALVVLWFYHLTVDIGRGIFKSLLPGSGKVRSNPAEEVIMATTINETPTPWGWSGHQSPEGLAKTQPALPTEPTYWGGKGNQDQFREHHPHHGGGASHAASNRRQNAGWPYREEKTEFAGKAYKVKRKVAARTPTPKTASKPWGW